MHNGVGEKFHASALFDGERWLSRVTLEVDPLGALSAVCPDTEPDAETERLAGPVIPGMPNLHSHAFQRAMAGIAEVRAGDQDSFWSWREAMYRLAARLDPDALEAIAAQAYIEMLKAGYTAVCEFHYVHRDPEGARYADPAELSVRVLAAARATGIGVTILPVLYQHAGFGGQPPSPRQRRFCLPTEDYLGLAEALVAATGGEADQAFGLAFHSLRAVTPDTIAEVLAAVTVPVPIHIHVAEQAAEVEDCLAHAGARPVAWLAGQVELDPRWALIHATHVDPAEVTVLARAGVVVGLCPTTEANLGDGLFPLGAFLAAGGRFGVGSDSQVTISPTDELRWLEYGQRLVQQRRNTVASAEEPHSGTALWRLALAGGAQAAGRPIGRLVEGARADWLVLDPESARWVGGDDRGLLLDQLVFSSAPGAIRDVMVGGRWRVRDRRHPDEDAVRARFLTVARRLNRGD